VVVNTDPRRCIREIAFIRRLIGFYTAYCLTASSRMRALRHADGRRAGDVKEPEFAGVIEAE